MDSRATNFRRDEDPRSVHNEDGHSILCTRTEKEKQRHRQEWLRQQEHERQHEELNQEKILEYERKRAQAIKLAERKPLRHSRSRSDSKSPTHHHYRGRSTSNASTGTLYEKLDRTSSGTVSLFKGPQGIQITDTELRRIKVDICRNIPATETTSELQRDIVNPEDVILKRREGEGCKPIFDREELKTVTVGAKVEEQRTVASVDWEQSVSTSKLRTSRKRSLSLSFTRKRVSSLGYLSSSRHRRSSSKRRREHKERYTERDASKYINHSRSKKRDLSTSNSRRSSSERRREHKERYTKRDAKEAVQRDAENTKKDVQREMQVNTLIVHVPENEIHLPQILEEAVQRDAGNTKKIYKERCKSFMEDRLRHEKSSESRSREKRDRDRDRSREPRDVTPHYIEPVHVPIYYGSFPPRPFVVSPMVPYGPRGQVPPMGRGRHPGLMAPVRPFPPRLIPPDMYRLGPPPNPRYGPY